MAVSRRQLIGDKVSGLCSGVSIVTGRTTVFRVVKDAGPGKGRERGYFPLCHIVCTGGGGGFFFFSLSHCLYGIKPILKGPAGALVVHHKGSI